MRRRSPTGHRRQAITAWVIALSVCVAPWLLTARAQDDVDELMRAVVAHRDDSWRALQQFLFTETYRAALRSDAGRPLWATSRESLWYMREGQFVRSPLRIDGRMVPEDERQRAEAAYRATADAPAQRAASPPVRADAGGRDARGVVSRVQPPQFLMSAYFLRMPFEAGRYAFLGRERVGGVDAVRLEYYPTRLFDDGARSRGDEAVYRALASAATRVTLWVDPRTQQILRYACEGMPYDFLPASWALRIERSTATMTMTEAFPAVWLPGHVDREVTLRTALGVVVLRESLDYTEFRQPDVQGRILSADVP